MGRRKTKGKKRISYKEVDSDDEYQQIQEPNIVAEELHPLPSNSRYPTEGTSAKVLEANMQSYALRDLAEEISSLPLEEDCELNKEASLNLTNREASPNLPHLVQKLNKNVSDAEEVDSASQSDLVAVAGYKVKGEIAPLLRNILNEHGDIASECILQTPETRAALLESVCMIYRELEPKFPNIRSLEVNSMQARIKDLETIRLRVEWLYKRLEEVSNVKGLLDKSRSLEEARAKCTESIERGERDLEALEVELANLQQTTSSKKANLALLKTEAESIEAAFRTMAKMGALPEKSTVSYTRRTSGRKWSMPNSQVKSRTDVQQPQQQSPIRLQTDNSYKFITDSYQQLRESGHPQPNHDSAAYLKDQSCNPHSHSPSAYLIDQSCNPHSHSPSYNLQCNSQQPYSQPQSTSQNLQHRSSQSNLLAHSNHHSKPQHSAQIDSENEHDQNYDASSDDVNDMDTPGDDYTPTNVRRTRNQGGDYTPTNVRRTRIRNQAEFSRERTQGLRGITKPLRGWGTGQKMMLQLNEKNQVIGKLASPFATQLGVLAKEGKKLPLIYTDWRTIPAVFTDRVWKEIKDNTNLPDDCERPILQRLSKLWRCWKGTVKESYFTPNRNDDNKLSQHPPDVRIEEDQWPVLVRFWKSKADVGTPTGHVQSYSPDTTPSNGLAVGNMNLPKFQKDALDMAVRAQVEEVVGNMRETMAVELVEIFSGVKQKSKSGLRGHMAFAVPSNGTQDVPESSRVQPPTSYFEDQRREIPYRDASSAEVY